MAYIEESHISCLRRHIEEQYEDDPVMVGNNGFGELLCHEIHNNNLTFTQLSLKWGLSLATLGELIWDHCKRLEKLPVVNHTGGTR